MTRIQKFLHKIGLCPKTRRGYYCHGWDGECGFGAVR